MLIAADGTARYASPSITRMIGYTVDEFVGQNVFRWMHPEDLPHTGQVFAELVQQPGPPREATFRYRHKNGNWRWIHGTGMNLLAQPSVQAVVGNFQDITEQKRLEQALRERAAELEEASHRKDEFLAMLAHELRNPLAPIRNAVQVRSFQPQVIFLDIGLPGMDGYELARCLRRQPNLDGAVLVALTGYGQDDDRRRAGAAGFDAHLVKPADPEVLHRLVAGSPVSAR